LAEPGGAGGGDPKWGPLGRPIYPWAGRTVVVKDDAGHQTVIHSDSTGEVTNVEVMESSSPRARIVATRAAVGRASPFGGVGWSQARPRPRRRGGRIRHDLLIAAVVGVAVVAVVGILAGLSVRKAPVKTGPSASSASASGVQVLSSSYSASTAPSNHVCAPRSVLITWTLRGARPGAVASVRVSGAGPSEQFNAPVGADGKTLKVSISLQTPSRWDAEVVAVNGKVVPAPASNPAGAITLDC
jgi:hypothetical protein